MKQVLQDLSTGKTRIAEVPAPRAAPGTLVIRSRASLVSAGTERMLVEFGQANLIAKARQQPDKVRQVIEKSRTDGIMTTLDAVRSKLDQPLPLGYCNAGVVVDVGKGVTEFKIGDRVVSNGPHAEIIRVPQMLAAKIPETVTDEDAAFAVLGAIALQGVRLAAPTLGECFVVMGLGLIGLITAQLLKANGCRVLGIDHNQRRLALAQEMGVEVLDLSTTVDIIASSDTFSRGRGVDGVLVTASTTSSEPIKNAAQMCRKRGRIVLVGVTGLELSRNDFYQKELTFQVSCSYGPGRYDPTYEEDGHDYPIGFVRWTEQRNFEAVLDMIAAGTVLTAPLITHRFGIADGEQAYQALTSDAAALGIVLGYGTDGSLDAELCRSVVALKPAALQKSGSAIVGLIGAGNYASRILAPALRKTSARMKTIVSSGGVTAAHHGGKSGFEIAATSSDIVFEDTEINTVVIATRHDTHASLVKRALACGKNVFVEKPLALTTTDIDDITALLSAAPSRPRLMVGFNRRFAPFVVEAKRALVGIARPKTFIITVNAGDIPSDHWTHDIEAGGGRIVGEACHFIDLLRFLVNAPITKVTAQSISGDAVTEDKATITLAFADGSMGTIHYFANGAKVFPKERIEVFAAGRIIQIDNFKRLNSYGWPGVKNRWALRQDKGQAACIAEFIKSVTTGGDDLIPLEELLEVARVSIEAAEMLRHQR